MLKFFFSFLYGFIINFLFVQKQYASKLFYFCLKNYKNYSFLSTVSNTLIFSLLYIFFLSNILFSLLRKSEESFLSGVFSPKIGYDSSYFDKRTFFTYILICILSISAYLSVKNLLISSILLLVSILLVLIVSIF